jgi:hypothetical protein
MSPRKTPGPKKAGRVLRKAAKKADSNRRDPKNGPRLDTQKCVAIVLKVLKVVIDQFTDGNETIVNEKGFTAECNRILLTPGYKAMDEMIHAAAISIGGFTFFKGSAKPKTNARFVDTDGKAFLIVQLRTALKTRLTLLAKNPGCEYLMLILVIAFPCPNLTRFLLVQW